LKRQNYTDPVKKPSLKNLGKQVAHVYIGADEKLLEAVPNPMVRYSKIRGRVIIVGNEFTSLCPYTGGSDFGKLTIDYIPNELIVESKSLKYYLESYRNHPIFHEEVIAKICTDLGILLKPIALKVTGEFEPRGGWAIQPEAAWYVK
jgi:7-cyano-7-deazaguanine reductase